MNRKFKVFVLFVMIVIFALLVAIPEKTHASKIFGGKKDSIPGVGDICNCDPPKHIDCWCIVPDPQQ
jgi:hypothetical protein